MSQLVPLYLFNYYAYCSNQQFLADGNIFAIFLDRMCAVQNTLNHFWWINFASVIYNYLQSHQQSIKPCPWFGDPSELCMHALDLSSKLQKLDD